jgi:hypothetical protein
MTLTNLIGNKNFLPDFKQSIPSKVAVTNSEFENFYS